MKEDTTLLKLLEAWQDGGLSAAEEAELLRQLDEDADLRQCFAGQVALIGAVRAAAEENPRWLALFDLLEQPEAGSKMEHLSFEDATMSRIEPDLPRAWYARTSFFAMAAAVAILLTGTFILKPYWPKDPSHVVAVPGMPPLSSVAVIIGSSPDAGRDAGTFLKPGLISQTTGWLTIQTLNGVSVTLDAPFRAELLSYDRILLNEGRARVRVPEGAEGFRLDSPAFDVVDLGTEFAAKVNTDGTGTCRVFEGKADVSLLDSIGEVKITHRLAANESVRVDPSGQEMQVIEQVNGDYPEIKQPPRPKLAIAASYPAEVLAMEPAGYWRFESIQNHEVADEVPNGARLQAAGAAAIASERDGNHSGDLTRMNKTEFFQIPKGEVPLLDGDFTISLFAQFSWLQNFALVAADRYDHKVQGNSFILQSYAAFRRTGLNGTGLHAVFRDPPAWDGGMEVLGNTLLRPQHWHHIAAIRKGDLVTLYLDGVMVGRETTGSMPLDYQQIYIGRLNANADQPRILARGLVGNIDELAIFTHALTEREIRILAMSEL